MGVWSFPFVDVKTARKFAQKMSTPWMATVYWDEEYEGYNWTAKGLGGIGAASLYGSDILWDYLFEIATKKKKDFDIRPYITECLKYDVWYHWHQVTMEYHPKALELVAEAIGVKVEKQRSMLVRQAAETLLDHLTENAVRWMRAEVFVRDNQQKWTLSIPRGVPAVFEKKKTVVLLFTTEKNIRSPGS